MDSKQIEIEGMKELLKENELEIGRLRKEIKNLKEERDNFMLKYSKAVEEKVVETNNLCTERNMLEEENRKLSEGKIIYASEKEQRHYVDILEENRKLKEDIAWYEKEEDRLREENNKLKLHIEAKDKAYTALLKDYEEIKEKNKNLKEKLEKQLGEMLFDVRN